MNTARPASAQTAREVSPAPTRPVTELLLELAYHLHTTRVVEVLPEPGGRPARRRRTAARLTASPSA